MAEMEARGGTVNLNLTTLAQTAAVLAIHECGHAAAALALGVRIKRVGLTWWGQPYIVREAGSTRQNAAVSLAGPLANLLSVAGVAWWIHATGRVPDAAWFCLFSLVQGVWNLLPVPASDGLRVYRLWRSA